MTAHNGSEWQQKLVAAFSSWKEGKLLDALSVLPSICNCSDHAIKAMLHNITALILLEKGDYDLIADSYNEAVTCWEQSTEQDISTLQTFVQLLQENGPSEKADLIYKQFQQWQHGQVATPLINPWSKEFRVSSHSIKAVEPTLTPTADTWEDRFSQGLNYFATANYESSCREFARAGSIAQKEGNILTCALAEAWQGWASFKMGDYTCAQDCYNLAEQHWNSAVKTLDHAQQNFLSSMVEYLKSLNFNEAHQAAEQLQKAIQGADSPFVIPWREQTPPGHVTVDLPPTGVPEQPLEILETGLQQWAQGHPERAEQHLFQARHKMDDKISQAVMENLLAIIYFQRGDYNSAQQSLKQSSQLWEEASKCSPIPNKSQTDELASLLTKYGLNFLSKPINKDLATSSPPPILDPFKTTLPDPLLTLPEQSPSTEANDTFHTQPADSGDRTSSPKQLLLYLILIIILTALGYYYFI